VLDELKETGYSGSELGDWGFMPTDPAVLRHDLATRGLTMTGAFVPIYFRDRGAHADGEARALRTAELVAAVATPGFPPYIVLADDNCRDEIRIRNAGRVTPAMGLSDADWQAFADGVNRIAAAVFAKTGLRSVFHHHGGGYVETHAEITRLLSMTDPAHVGLVFDTGHYAYGGQCLDGDGILRAMQSFAERIYYVHLKDCSASVVAQAHAGGWDYHTAIRQGVFCELGAGCVPFDRVLAWLKERGYQGFATVEQDVLPGMGQPRESAARNRAYLKSLGV
jgi:inosose dehydratase